MLEEPYRWVEAMRNRREYLDDQLQGAAPVIGLGFEHGLLMLTSTPGPRKIFEVYNQVAFAAIGHPADIEKLRKSVIDIAHVEAFNFSASDISLQRLVSFGLGPLIKSAFDEIFRSPYTARGLMAELDPPAEQDALYMIDADGSFSSARGIAAVAGSSEVAAVLRRRLEQDDAPDAPLHEAVKRAIETWAVGRIMSASREGEPDQSEILEFLARELPQVRLEAAVLDRSRPTKTKFRLLTADELQEAATSYSA